MMHKWFYTEAEEFASEEKNAKVEKNREEHSLGLCTYLK